MKALLLGSLSVLADTSELQRDAFNTAFAETGLDWHWSREAYGKMLISSGGRDRIALFAATKGVQVDSAALHDRKTAIFQARLGQGTLPLRSETSRLVQHALRRNAKIACVSGTARASLDALLSGFGGAAELGIDLVTSADLGLAPKPDPALFLHALDKLDVTADQALAIEDNRAGIDAAMAAGIETLAYPNINTAEHDFSDVAHVTAYKTLSAA